MEAAVKREYIKRDGFVIRAPIEKVGAHLEALKEANPTRYDKQFVVDDARDPASPIHNCFTWDDTKAAHKQRLHEAQYLMTCYVVRTTSNSTTINICPGSVSVRPEPNRRIYVSPPVAMNNYAYKQQVLSETMGQLNGMAARLRNLQGLSPEVLRKLDQLEKLIREEMARDKDGQGPRKAKAGTV